MGAFRSRLGVVMVVVSSLAAGACASDEGGDDEADPTVEVGYLGSGEFRAIEAGDPCWVSEADLTADITLRTVGMASDAGMITCALVDAELGALGYWHSQRLFSQADDGARQVTLRMRLDAAGGFAAIDGRAVTLQCEVVDDVGLYGGRMVDVVVAAAE